jgi:hypothetical protein
MPHFKLASGFRPEKTPPAFHMLPLLTPDRNNRSMDRYCGAMLLLAPTPAAHNVFPPTTVQILRPFA